MVQQATTNNISMSRYKSTNNIPMGNNQWAIQYQYNTNITQTISMNGQHCTNGYTNTITNNYNTNKSNYQYNIITQKISMNGQNCTNGYTNMITNIIPIRALPIQMGNNTN